MSIMRDITMNTTDLEAKINYFNKLGSNWDEVVGNNSERIDQLRDVFKMIELKTGDRVLDVGCGNGVLFPLIEEKIGADGIITALDPAESMILRAKKLYPDYINIDFIIKSIEFADLKISYYDAIICFAVFPHIEDKMHALSLFRRALKNSGKLYIFHLSDTKSLNEFHSSVNGPVCKDMMPEQNELENMQCNSSFTLIKYIDKKKLNFIECGTC
ncbi:MAG: class I SAM-dependent methyltransferase [Spirochaetota bacterium]